jgi:hypothetical protein
MQTKTTNHTMRKLFRVKFTIVLIVSFFSLISCERIQWNLDKKPESLVKTIDCSSLVGLNTQYTYWNGFGYTNTPWVVYQNGYLGSCIRADNPNLTGNGANGGLVEFQQDFSTEGFIKCWTISGGNANQYPDLYVDGVLLGPMSFADGSTFQGEWMQVKSGLITAGLHQIKIDFGYGSPIPTLDEIEVWELK